MIQRISSLPDTMVGFRAVGEITREDYDEVVIPAVYEIVEKTGQLNYLLVIDTSLQNFTAGAWIKDAILGIKNLTKWHRAAIVTESAVIRKFTDFFSALIPGEFKGFSHEHLQEAIDWISSKESVSANR
ncbi:MAG TPA: STAS/SEC14 domain-containing protein [Cytophagaceae bacterium]|jgi:hypothetical protein|nr:STAS/SEC14 domain-containing protein [Cytophagaceae bacterium]